jgi:autotransporter-associated beta strand protein
MTTAQARAVPSVFATLRGGLLASASAGLLIALAPAATAAPVCTGDGTANTCVIGINLGEADIATESVDALGTPAPPAPPSVDTLQFNSGNLSLDQAAIGAALSATVRFANFEAAIVSAGATLNMSSASATTTTQSLTWTVDGTLNVTGGNAIGDGSAMTVAAGGVFNVNDSETIGALAGAGSIVVAATEVLTADGSSALDAVTQDLIGTTFSGVISGAGGFTKGGLGMLRLTGANTFAGALNINGGILEVGNADAISSASGVTLTGGAQLTAKGVANYTIGGPVTITSGRIGGNAIINGNVLSNGGIQPGNTSVPTFIPGSTVIPKLGNIGQDMGTVRINGNYGSDGTSAYVGMFINIDTAAAGGAPGVSHDYLDIDGNITNTGTNRTNVQFASHLQNPVGAPTTGNGIQVIRISGTNAGNDFYQLNQLVAGPYQYLLRYVADYNPANDDGYFLQSAARDELVAHAGLLSAGQSLIRNCFRDEQRIPDSPKGATYGRAWFGYRQGSSSNGPDTGIDMDQDFSCTTGGMDWRMGHGWFGGVSGGFGSSDGDLAAPSGNGKLDGDARVIEAYAAFTSSAFFLNLSAGYTDIDWRFTGALNPFGAEASSSGFIGQAQAGIGLGLEPLAVKLIASLNYDGTNCGDSCFGFAVTEDTGLLEGRGTVRFDGITWGGSIRPWAAVSYSTVLSDGINTVTGGVNAISADTNDELLLIDAGLHSYLDENLALYLDGGYHKSLGKDINGYRAGIGLKLYW